MTNKAQIEWIAVVPNKRVQSLIDVAIEATEIAKAALIESASAKVPVGAGRKMIATLNGRFGSGPSVAVVEAKTKATAKVKAIKL